MERILEPEVMDNLKNVEAYANANFEISHNSYIEKFKKIFPNFKKGMALDIGCGPADVTIRFSKTLPQLKIDGIDASQPMIDLGKKSIYNENLVNKISLFKSYINKFQSQKKYDLIFSTSLLHHLPDPNVLWRAIKKFSKKGTIIFIADLLRPKSKEQAREIVEKYSRSEPKALKDDFYNSLLASFNIREIKRQLEDIDLNKKLTIEKISDRHLIIYGTM